MAAAAARGVNDVSRAHVGSLGTRPRRRKWVRRCLASTLAQDGVGVDLLWLAEDLRGLHVFRDVFRVHAARCVPDLRELTPTALNKIRESLRGVRLLVVAKLVVKFYSKPPLRKRDRHHASPKYECQRRRSRQPRVSSLKHANLARERAARANAPLARLPAWGNAAVGDTSHDAQRGRGLAARSGRDSASGTARAASRDPKA